MMQFLLLYYPIFLAAILLIVAMFGHLNFKLVKIQIVQWVSSVIAGVFAYYYFTNMYFLNVTYGVYATTTHYLLMISFVVLSLVFMIVLKEWRLIPRQILGAGLFVFSAYLFLAQ